MPITQGSFTIDATGTVTIGEGHSTGNQVAITIKNTGSAQSKVRVTIGVKCGNTPEGLLHASSARVVATYDAPVDPKGNLSATTSQPPDSRSWQTSSKGNVLNTDQMVTIKLAGFESNTPPGDAPLDIQVYVYNGSDWVRAAGTDSQSKLVITKKAEQKEKPAIHYFSVSPDFVLHAGQTPVELGFYATGFDSLVLFRNNQEVESWPSNQHPKNDDGSITGTFEDRPSITTAYRLEGKTKTEGEKVKNIKYRSVQVISPGWNQLSLPQGYPARLFVNSDFSGSGSGMARLYGIFLDGDFRDPRTNAALYSSATGVDDWRLEVGDIPKYRDDEGVWSMATSPGVAYKDKLWLIGGSCVNPDRASAEVWCYELDTQTREMRWVRKGTFPPAMQPRAGHACVVVPRQNRQGREVEELWVLGGVNNGVELGDVWKLEEDQTTWTRLQPSGNSWPARHMHAAVSFTPAPDRPTEVWLYGGNAENTLLTDIWGTSDGGSTWQTRTGISPPPGGPLGTTLVAYNISQAAINQRLFLGGTFLDPTGSSQPSNRSSSVIFEWQWRNKVWEARPVPDGWQRFEGSRFYMQAVSFNTFLFVWSLHTAIKAPTLPKLNILIS